MIGIVLILQSPNVKCKTFVRLLSFKNRHQLFDAYSGLFTLPQKRPTDIYVCIVLEKKALNEAAFHIVVESILDPHLFPMADEAK